MPNWCWNTLKLNKKYAWLVLNDKGNVDFNIARPMPESLNVESGSSNDTDMYVYLSARNNISLDTVRDNPLSRLIRNNFSPDWLAEVYSRVRSYSKKEMLEAYERGKVLIDNYLKYGACTWYEWCNENWGTKWNASDSDVSKEAGDTWYIHFDTAWCPPDGWLKRLAELKVPFELTWEEESGYAGTISFDGQCWSEEERELDWEEEE